MRPPKKPAEYIDTSADKNTLPADSTADRLRRTIAARAEHASGRFSQRLMRETDVLFGNRYRDEIDALTIPEATERLGKLLSKMALLKKLGKSAHTRALKQALESTDPTALTQITSTYGRIFSLADEFFLPLQNENGLRIVLEENEISSSFNRTKLHALLAGMSLAALRLLNYDAVSRASGEPTAEPDQKNPHHVYTACLKELREKMRAVFEATEPAPEAAAELFLKHTYILSAYVYELSSSLSMSLTVMGGAREKLKMTRHERAKTLLDALRIIAVALLAMKQQMRFIGEGETPEE